MGKVHLPSRSLGLRQANKACSHGGKMKMQSWEQDEDQDAVLEGSLEVRHKERVADCGKSFYFCLYCVHKTYIVTTVQF